MRLAEKVGKLGNGKAVESVQRHLRRMFFDWRHGIHLDSEGLVSEIDRRQFAVVRGRHLASGSQIGWQKYLNLRRWMQVNLNRVKDLGLDHGIRRRILDLGCGAGYFLFILQILGHDVVGLDIDESPLFSDMILLLGLSRVIWQIRPFVRLPRFGPRFDLVTAFSICFNGHKSSELWGTKEWAFFLDDLNHHLNPGGQVCLGFNREENGQFYDSELRELFAERGAVLHTDQVILTRGRDP